MTVSPFVGVFTGQGAGVRFCPKHWLCSAHCRDKRKSDEVGLESRRKGDILKELTMHKPAGLIGILVACVIPIALAFWGAERWGLSRDATWVVQTLVLLGCCGLLLGVAWIDARRRRASRENSGKSPGEPNA